MPLNDFQILIHITVDNNSSTSVTSMAAGVRDIIIRLANITLEEGEDVQMTDMLAVPPGKTLSPKIAERTHRRLSSSAPKNTETPTEKKNIATRNRLRNWGVVTTQAPKGVFKEIWHVESSSGVTVKPPSDICTPKPIAGTGYDTIQLNQVSHY